MRTCCVSETQSHGRRTKTVLNQLFVELNRREKSAKLRFAPLCIRNGVCIGFRSPVQHIFYLKRSPRRHPPDLTPTSFTGNPRPPDFLFAALDMAACAAFITESRMKFASANRLHRKSGSGCSSICAVSLRTFPTALPTFQAIICSAGKGRSRSNGSCAGLPPPSQRA
jgi:hypothetical protein